MKIAYILPSLANKGPIIVVNNIVKNLYQYDEVEKIDIYYFDDKFGVNFDCDTIKIDDPTKAIDFDKYDIVHSHGYRPDKYVVKWKKTIKNAKLVSTIHSDIARDLSYTYNPLISLVFSRLWFGLYKKMTSISVISNKLYSLYKHRLNNLEVVYNGVEIETENLFVDQNIIDQIKVVKSKGYKIIGTYAALTKIKGIDMLISLLDKRKDIALVIIGEGKDKKQYEDIVKSKGYDERVLFFPYLKHPYKYIIDFDVYAMPSRSEGFGLAMVEAALCNIPVVCSDIDVFREIFDNKEAAFFELENIDSLSSAIDNAITNRDSFIVNAYKKASENFTGKVMAGNYFKLYQKTINCNAKI